MKKRTKAQQIEEYETEIKSASKKDLSEAQLRVARFPLEALTYRIK